MPTEKRWTPAKRLPPDRRTGRGVTARAVGSFVPKIAANVFERYGFHSAEIMTSWDRVAGADIAACSSPERIRWPRNIARSDAEDAGGGRDGGATLLLRVDPARALDIEYRTREIIDRINRYFGYRAVADVKLLQAPLLAPPPSVPRQKTAASRIETNAEKVAPGAAPEVADALARLATTIAGATP